MEVKFWNQPNTFPAVALPAAIYASNAKNEQKMIATKGRPFLEVLRKILGALPDKARPSKEELSDVIPIVQLRKPLTNGSGTRV